MIGNWKKLMPGYNSRQSREFSAYTIEQSDGITYITATSSPSIDETLAVVRYIGDNNLARRRVWDFRQIDFPFTTDEVRLAAEHGKQFINGENRFSIVIKDDLGLGTMNVFKVHREQDGQTNARVFKDMDEAVTWLSQPF